MLPLSVSTIWLEGMIFASYGSICCGILASQVFSNVPSDRMQTDPSPFIRSSARPLLQDRFNVQFLPENVWLPLPPDCHEPAPDSMPPILVFGRNVFLYFRLIMQWSLLPPLSLSDTYCLVNRSIFFFFAVFMAFTLRSVMFFLTPLQRPLPLWLLLFQPYFFSINHSLLLISIIRLSFNYHEKL